MFDVCQIKHGHQSSPKGTYVSMSDQKLFNENQLLYLALCKASQKRQGKKPQKTIVLLQRNWEWRVKSKPQRWLNNSDVICRIEHC